MSHLTSADSISLCALCAAALFPNLSVARVTSGVLRVVPMLYSEEQYQAILDKQRNGVSLAKGLIAGLAAALCAMELAPDELVTFLQEKSMVEAIFEATDEMVGNCTSPRQLCATRR